MFSLPFTIFTRRLADVPDLPAVVYGMRNGKDF